MQNKIFEPVDKSWVPIVKKAWQVLSSEYQQKLLTSDYLPGAQNLFRAFSLPLEKTHYILFGESPYPRKQSANGYAFWDAAVQELWSNTGLSKQVNRATSLRNLIKMMLLANHHLDAAHLTSEAIAQLPKEKFVQTGSQLFESFLRHGFLLLNLNLVLSQTDKKIEAREWLKFHQVILEQLCAYGRQDIQLVIFGKIADQLNRLEVCRHFSMLVAEHPYNLSFISNSRVLDFFEKMDLLAIHQ